MIKKNDVILIVSLVLLGVLAVGVLAYKKDMDPKKGKVVVYVDEKKYAEYPLDKDETKKVESGEGKYNILQIKDGCVSMKKASCPDQICVRHRKISKEKESIVCLPNKLVIVIENGTPSDIDGMTN